MAQQERAVKTRRHIVEAAAEEFAERGYEAATCANIASRAGVTRGAFYFHFTSKNDVAGAVLSEWIARQPTAGPLPFKLQELMERAMATARQLKDDPVVNGCFRLCLEEGLGVGERQRPYLIWSDRYKELLESAREQGALHPDAVTSETAELLIGAFAGARLASQILPEGADVEQRVVSFLRHLLPHVATPQSVARLGLTPPAGPYADD
ncbi:ScbR family autoregulator-binding transcription factor [Streptomyces sp. NPDC051219]|uniref:ScbR family autoregulator-binding transcription factor n=1 Tax=Streptomyces sp. NPDC051219 TaxID=3155283 RepID=UPI003433906B